MEITIKSKQCQKCSKQYADSYACNSKYCHECRPVVHEAWEKKRNKERVLRGYKKPEAVREKKEMEYEDAPSGYVTMYNYKEPFMKFEDGHGFEGVLLYDGGTDKIQCHFCGEWFHTLQHHLRREHAMRVSEYKEKVGLNKGTALISETFRATLIKNGMKTRMENFKKNTHKVSEETKEKIRATLKKNSRETQNTRGTCPEQLIDRLKKAYMELGYTPESKKLPFQEALLKVYGSYEKACEIAGIPPRKPGQTIRWEERSENNRLKLIRFFRDFYEEHKRFPTFSELDKKHSSWMYKYGRKNIEREVGLLLNGAPRRVQYTKEELLDFIRRFKAINGREPSASDCRRKLLPGYGRYHYNFGSLIEACRLVRLGEVAK